MIIQNYSQFQQTTRAAVTRILDLQNTLGSDAHGNIIFTLQSETIVIVHVHICETTTGADTT